MSYKQRIMARKAKELSLEIWRYLAAHTEIDSKSRLPSYIRKKIKDYRFACPLCGLYFENGAVCPKCPLESCIEIPRSNYSNWLFAYNEEQRREAAQKIVAILEAWEPKE